VLSAAQLTPLMAARMTTMRAHTKLVAMQPTPDPHPIRAGLIAFVRVAVT
jgi:hypothetical protein